MDRHGALRCKHHGKPAARVASTICKPAASCTHGHAVLHMHPHPQSRAASTFPSVCLRSARRQSVGSSLRGRFRAGAERGRKVFALPPSRPPFSSKVRRRLRRQRWCISGGSKQQGVVACAPLCRSSKPNAGRKDGSGPHCRTQWACLRQEEGYDGQRKVLRLRALLAAGAKRITMDG